MILYETLLIYIFVRSIQDMWIREQSYTDYKIHHYSQDLPGYIAYQEDILWISTSFLFATWPWIMLCLVSTTSTSVPPPPVLDEKPPDPFIV